MIKVLKKEKINSSFFWKKYEEIFETTKLGLYKKICCKCIKKFYRKKSIFIKVVVYDN